MRPAGYKGYTPSVLHRLDDAWKTPTGIAVERIPDEVLLSYLLYGTGDHKSKQFIHNVLDIELKQYKYNNLGLSDNLVYGFIAQQVKEVYESAIDYGDGVIHDINKYFDFDYDNSSNIIKLFMDDRDNSYNEIELIVETKIVEKDNSGNDYDNYTSTKKTYTIKNKTENYIEIDYTNKEKYPDRIFATGHYIRDFHYIQKQRIFTLHHGAIQDIYKEQQADKAEIAELKNELKEMKTMLNALKSHLGL